MFKRDNNAGLYLTIAFHLLIIIILLATKIHSVISDEAAFVLDFTQQEAIEEEQRQEVLKEEVNKEIDDILAGRAPANRATAVRNVVVDASSAKGEQLKDDRYKDPSKIYDEARSLQEKLRASKREAEAYRGSDNVAKSDNSNNSQTTIESYKGPSVISYSLDGRKAVSLPIPVYKCYGGGDVSVLIKVDRKGYVVAASIIASSSSNDICLQEYAIRAAKSSRFTASATAPDRQTGEIVYRFIAQ